MCCYVQRSRVYLGSPTKHTYSQGLSKRTSITTSCISPIIPALPAGHRIISASGRNYRQRDML
ncbi:hypothetical protein COCC4DRAFT_33498, partial [Bipolaris maydis ATCC 48331]